MTRDPRNFPAGRHLDALIAKKIMGRKVQLVTEVIGTIKKEDGSREPMERSDWRLINEDGTPYMVHGPLMHGYFQCPVASYSTDITQAWEVIKKLGGCVILYYTDNKQDYWDEPHWVCGLKAHEDGPEYDFDCSYATAETAPLAICRAALLTLGGYQ